MSAPGLSKAELAELDGFIADDDHDSVCAAVGRHMGERIAAYLRRKKPNRQGREDPEKAARHLHKAQFKGLVDYLMEHERMGRDDAFYEALRICPMPDEDVAWDIAIGKRGEITRLSEVCPNPYVEARSSSQISKLGMRSRK